MLSMSKCAVKLLIALTVFVCFIEADSSENFVCTTDKHRPKYHFSPKSSWMNDPNGMVYYDGVYHLFYQHYPDGIVWGSMYWGHAISRDLATWEELPIALEPNSNGAIFSGSAVVDYENTAGFKTSPFEKDPVVAIYTSALDGNIHLQRQSLAYSLDGGFNFKDYAENPVLTDPDSPDFRDPKVFNLDGRWIMSLAVNDRIEFYASPDLKKWTKQSEIGRNPEIGNHDGVWECPDLIRLNVNIDGTLKELWVLLVSINPGGPNGGSATQYFIGEFINSSISFEPYQWSENQWLDWGPDNYAGVTFSNEPNGRQVYIGWMSNWNYADKTPNQLHRGQMTIPRQLGLHVLDHDAKQYRLTSLPVPELAALRNPNQSYIQYDSVSVAPQTRIDLTEINFNSPTMEIEIDLEMKNNPQFSLCAFNDVDEEICFGFNSSHWFIDRSKSGHLNFSENYVKSLGAYAPREIIDESTSVRIFLDVSSIEVFTDFGLTTMTALFFPSKPLDKLYINNWGSAGLSTVTLKNLRVHGLTCWFGESSAGSNFHLFSLAMILIASVHFVNNSYL